MERQIAPAGRSSATLQVAIAVAGDAVEKAMTSQQQLFVEPTSAMSRVK